MRYAHLKRIIKYGLMSFWRNGWISVATIFTMVLTLFVLGSLVFSNVLMNSALDRIKDKVDISVYFKSQAEEQDILALQKSLLDLPQVKSADYISKEQALKEFKERHANNALIIQSLEELDSNPLKASLNIKAKDPEQYEAISKFLDEGEFNHLIDKINYFQNKIVIERLSKILDTSHNVGMIITLVLAFIAISVTFNTIRLAIYNNRAELKIMRLVGATNNFIRGPFMFEGVLYGVISGIITIIIFLPLTYWLGPKTLSFFGGPNIFDYFMDNFFKISILLIAVGSLLGAASSYIAVSRYLKG